MKNLENKNILNVEKNNKKQSVFDNSEVVLNILYNILQNTVLSV